MNRVNLLIFLLSQFPNENEDQIKINPVSIQINLKEILKKKKSRFAFIVRVYVINRTTNRSSNIEENPKHASAHRASTSHSSMPFRKKNKQKDLAYYGAIINSDLGISRAVERLNTASKIVCDSRSTVFEIQFNRIKPF